MSRIVLHDDTIHIGQVAVSFQRTLRIPDDGREYPLPPGLSRFPLRRVRDYEHRVPAPWRERGGFFLPMFQREALWIAFDAPHWRPHAVRVGTGGVNAVSGGRWGAPLSPDPQDYLVVPGQPWLDGINAGAGFVRQFVAAPLGRGLTVEAQVTGAESEGGVQLEIVPPVPGRFPERPPRIRRLDARYMVCCEAASPAMGLAAGGRMQQRIHPDPHGLATWDVAAATAVQLHIVDSLAWTAITGERMPWSPVTAEEYTAAGLPWFSRYDEHLGDLPASPVLAGVRSYGELAGHDAVDAPSPDVAALGSSSITA